MEITPSSGNVFLDLSFPPEEAENLKIRSALMISIRRVFESRGLQPTDAAELFGVTPSCVDDVVSGKVDLSRFDSLVNMLGRAGLRVEFSVERVGA